MTTPDAPAPGALLLPTPPAGLFVGEAWRYPHHNLLVRWAADLVAIPTGVVSWSRNDLGVFAAWSAAGLALMVGPVPGDVQVQAWAHGFFGLRDTRFTVWTKLGDASFAVAEVLIGLCVLLPGLLYDMPLLVELFSLSVEAFSVAQIFHVATKLLVGREGPMDGSGNAVIYGPSRSVSLYPSGTPSGHAASLYAVLGTVSLFVDRLWLTVGLHVFGALFCGTMLIDDYHFLSDLLWGAAMGWSVGEWVVRHRSTVFREQDGVNLRITPVLDLRTGSAAIAVAFRF